nr:hypothetical protein [Rhodococcus sp. MS16]
MAQRHGARIVRTRVEVQEQTEVGDAMIRGLVRAQLGLAIRLAVVVAGSLCAIPLSTMLFPALSDYSVWGIRLPWLVMGGAVLPLLLITGWVFVRRAERNEQDFTNLVDD